MSQIDDWRSRLSGGGDSEESIRRREKSEAIADKYRRRAAERAAGSDTVDAVCFEYKNCTVVPAVEADWDTEYNDYILAVHVVESYDEAVEFISAHGTGHSEAIITSNYFTSQHFLDEIDAAAVYVNASTRFTDGGEFGLGAEIGISTQKLHARGPMGLEELTSCKYVIYGEGQIR